MRNLFPAILLILFACASCSKSRVSLIKGFPENDTCYAKGVSGLYAGVLGNRLVIGGGSNFPHKPLVSGGSKEYYNNLYAGEIADDSISFSPIGSLPSSMAYGACLEYAGSLVFIGGLGNDSISSKVMSLSAAGDDARWKTLPDLPFAMDSFGACRCGSRLVVAGGKAEGRASAKVLFLDMNDLSAGWQIVGDMPGGPRIQCVSASAGDKILIWGGYSQKEDGSLAEGSNHGLAYSFSKKVWSEIASPLDKDGNPLLVAGGSSVSWDDDTILLMGGVCFEIFRNALGGMYKDEEYLSFPVSWYRFNRGIYEYDVPSGKISKVADCENTARAGASVLRYGNSLLVVGGEVKPGIRTGMISRIELN